MQSRRNQEACSGVRNIRSCNQEAAGCQITREGGRLVLARYEELHEETLVQKKKVRACCVAALKYLHSRVA